MNLKPDPKVDIEKLKQGIAEAEVLLILIGNKYIEDMKNPEDLYHVALNVQIQEAAKGEKDVYLLVRRPVERNNFTLLMDMLEGSKLKTIVFIDPKEEEDMERAARIVAIAMGPRIRISGTSKDAIIEGSPPSP